MKQSVKMWALQTEGGTLARVDRKLPPELFINRADARWYRDKSFPTSKVVRVQVDITVVE